MAAEPSSTQPPGKSAIRRWIAGVVLLLACLACAPFLFVGAGLVLVALTTRPGIGDVAQAQARIKAGMTREEVRAALGSPHQDGADEWDSYETRFVGSVLRIHFGPDGRVTSREWWVH